MSDVKRYEAVGFECEIEECDYGEFVKHADHLAAISAAQARCERLAEALRFYAHEPHWPAFALHDRGNAARAALEEPKR
jgi:hypothetical protein